MRDRITLRAKGLMLERLLDLALREGICFREINREDDRGLRLVTNAGGAKKLLFLAEKYRVDCSVCERRGPGVMFRAARSRFTLVVGLLLCALCAWQFLSRVWQIEVRAVDGAAPVELNALRADLRRLNVYPGMARSKLDTILLEERLSAGSGGYAYIGASLEGVRLLIEAAAEAPEPEVYEIDDARDLVAAADGIIVSVNVRAGKACVKPGDTVRRGQVLIRGEERVSKEQSRGIQALGEVIARTWFTGEAAGARRETRRRFTGRTSISTALRLEPWRLPLSQGEALSPAEVETEILPVGGLFLPLAVERVTQREYEETRVEVDPAALKQTLEETALIIAEAEMLRAAGPESAPVRQWIDHPAENAGTLRARAVLEVRRNIAVTRDSLFQGGS